LQAQAQAVGGLRIENDYRGRLCDVLTQISKDLNLRLVYDSTSIARYTVNIYPQQTRNINAMLKLFRTAWDMETLVSDDGYIYIAKDKAQLAALQQKQAAINLNKAATTTSSPENTDETSAAVNKHDGIVRQRNFRVTGNITDVDNGERIPYATVSVFGSQHWALSDANGYFVLENVPTDTVTLAVQYIGYQTKYVRLGSVKDKTLQIEMEPQPLTIAEVFIIGRKDDKALQQSTGEHKMKMSPIALKILPNIGEKDIMRGFQLMPGVSASNENSSGMYVRGGTPDQNLILYDGFTVYYVDHLHGFYSAFNANAVKDVQLYKGGFEAKYGGRLSSVTEITAKDGNSKAITVGAEVNLLSVNAYAEFPIKDKFTSLIAFRRSYQGYMYSKINGQTSGANAVTTPAATVPSGGGGFGGGRPGGQGMELTVPESYFYDINAKLTYYPTKNDIVSLSILNGTDYVDNTPQFSFPGGGGGGFGGTSMSMENNDYENYGNTGSSVRWARKWNEKLTSSTLASFSNFYSVRDQTRSVTRNDTTTQSGTLEKNNLIDVSVKSDWKYSLNDRNVLEGGLFASYYDIGYTYSEVDTTNLLDKASRAAVAGVYVQDHIKLASAHLTVTPGVRLTYFSPTAKVYAEPRLNAGYQFGNLQATRRLTLNAASGIFYQFANRIVREDVMSGNTYFWILSDNKEIPVSRSVHFNLGLNYDLPDYLFSVEGYYKLNADISEYTLRFERNFRGGMGRPGGAPAATTGTVSEQFFTGSGYATGLEFLAQKKAGAFNGWISYTLGEVKNCFPLQNEKYFFAYQDVTHEFKTVGIYKFGDWDFSASFIYSTGRPYTAPLGAYQVADVGGSAQTYYALSDKNNFRLPDYIRLDFAINYRFNHPWSKGKPNAVSFSLFNALNRKNVSAKQFYVIDNQIMESNINYLGITPNLSLTFKF
jgi:hypothetical protein